MAFVDTRMRLLTGARTPAWLRAVMKVSSTARTCGVGLFIDRASAVVIAAASAAARALRWAALRGIARSEGSEETEEDSRVDLSPGLRLSVKELSQSVE